MNWQVKKVQLSRSLNIQSVKQRWKCKIYKMTRAEMLDILLHFSGIIFLKTKTTIKRLTLARTSHCLNLHFCLILLGPPNFFMSLQKSHWAQSSVLLQGSHSPHIRTDRFTSGKSDNGQWEPLQPKKCALFCTLHIHLILQILQSNLSI